MRKAGKWGNRPTILARATMKCSVALAGLAFATQARAECSREMLRELTKTYVEAQSTGNPTLLPVAAGSY